jgi:hypothetical protein
MLKANFGRGKLIDNLCAMVPLATNSKSRLFLTFTDSSSLRSLRTEIGINSVSFSGLLIDDKTKIAISETQSSDMWPSKTSQLPSMSEPSIS